MKSRTPADVLADIGDAFSSACAIRNSSRALQVATGIYEELVDAVRHSNQKRARACSHLRALVGDFSAAAFYSELPQLSEKVYSLFSNHVAKLIASDSPEVSAAGLDLAQSLIYRCNMWLGSAIEYEKHFVSDIFTLQFFLILKTIGPESPHFPKLFLAYKNSLSLILLTADQEASARGLTFVGDILILAQEIKDPDLKRQRIISLLGDCHRLLWTVLGPTPHGAAGNLHNWRVKRHAIYALSAYPKLAVELDVEQLANDCLYLFYDACYRDSVLLESCRYRLIQTAATVITAGKAKHPSGYQDNLFKIIGLCIQDSRPLFQVQNIVWIADLIKASVEANDPTLLKRLLSETASGILKIAEENPSYYRLIRHFAVASFVFLTIHGHAEIGKDFVQSSTKSGEPLSINSGIVRDTVKEYYGHDIPDDTINSVLRSNFRPTSPPGEA